MAAGLPLDIDLGIEPVGVGELDIDRQPFMHRDVDQLAQAYVELAVLRLHNWRTLSRLARGEEPGPESSWVKLAWTDLTQHLSDAALDVVDPESPLWGKWQRQWLWSKAASIAGGTSEIQRTIIGDRILGLPR